MDGKTIDCGYFVTLDGEKIRKADESDDYVLGITSSTPAVIANSGDLNWKDKYVTDEWGGVLYQDVRCSCSCSNIKRWKGNPT
ncbi:hypothetical protein FDA79_04285 [Clostridium botulinum]|nr:hypothetical protein [Clostridium botulinum]NFI76346.1 hypothetical protein [Clostridium botulinum]NFJ36047.1 hypothetical protein [Clostridium botulinum]NFS22623.1 hypothetical protein [Clostridium botulinum]